MQRRNKLPGKAADTGLCFNPVVSVLPKGLEATTGWSYFTKEDSKRDSRFESSSFHDERGTMGSLAIFGTDLQEIYLSSL